MPRLRFIPFFLCLLPAALHSDEVAQAFFDNHAYQLSADAWQADLRKSNSFDAEAKLGLAQSYQRLGNFRDAESSYQDFLDRHPADSRAPEAWLGLALSLQSQGRFEDSERAVDAFLANYASHPLAPQAAFARADNLYGLGHYQEADAAYAKVLTDYPHFENPEYIPYSRAWCLFELSQSPSRGGSEAVQAEALSKAAELFAGVVTDYPHSVLAPVSLYQEGESLYAAGNYEAARAAYGELELKYREDPLVAAARYSMAWCSFEEEKWQEASDAFHKFAVVHEDHPLAPWAMYLAGVSLAREGNYDLAESAYDLTLSKYPGSPCEDKARYGLAWLATMRHDYVAASQAWQDFLDHFPQSDLAPSAVFLRADALYHQERYASAREDYELLLKNYPDHPLAEDALFFVAGCSLAQGEAPRAQDEYQQFLRTRPESPYAAQAKLHLGDAYYAQGQYAKARESYQALLGDPASKEAPLALSGLAWIAFQEKNWDESYQNWKKLADNYPEHPLVPQSLVYAGDSLYNENRYDEALALYKSAAEKAQGTDVESLAQFQSGWAYYRLKDFDLAYAAWSACRERSKDLVRGSEAAYWMGWALFRKGDYLGAAQAFGDMHSNFPQSHLAMEALLRQADSLYNAKSFDQAITIYQSLVNLNPNDGHAAAALEGIQWCYYALGKDDEAIAASKEYLEKHHDSDQAPEVQYHVAEHYVNRGDYKQAEKELDTLKAAYPSSKEDILASYWRGEARMKNLNFNGAIEDWKEMLSKAPANNLAPKAAFNIGLAYYRLQEYPEALEAFKGVIDSYGNTPAVAADALFNSGMTYKRMQRDEDAVKAYQDTIAKYPDSPLANMARIRIGYIYEDNHSYEKAIAAYSDLASHDSSKLGAEAQYLVGDCYMEEGKTGEALLAYQADAERFKDVAAWRITSLAKIGEIEESLGHDKKALLAYQAIVKEGGDPTWIASAQKRIEDLQARLGQEKSSGTSAPLKKKQKPEAGVAP